MSNLSEEDLRLLAATVERLAVERYSIDRCRVGNKDCDADEWQAFAEQGVFALGIEPAYGGIGGGASGLGMVMRQVGRNLLALPYLDTVVLGAAIVRRLGSDEQKAALLPAIVEGALRLSLAHREPDAGDKRDHVRTTAVDGRLSGLKSQVLDAAANQFIVSARDEEGALRLYLVDREQQGLAIQTYRLPDNRLAAKMYLTDVTGEALGGPADEILDQVFDLAAACVAAEAVGAIEALNRETLAYAKVRKQFGVPIGSFQALQHRLVDMFIAEQTASALVVDALAAIEDGGADANRLVSAAKAQADRAGRFVGESAIQIHGGMGMTDECSVGHHLKRVLTIGSQFGTADWHIARLASLHA